MPLVFAYSLTGMWERGQLWLWLPSYYYLEGLGELRREHRSFVSSLKDEFISMADMKVKEQMMKNPEVLLHTEDREFEKGGS